MQITTKYFPNLTITMENCHLINMQITFNYRDQPTDRLTANQEAPTVLAIFGSGLSSIGWRRNLNYADFELLKMTLAVFLFNTIRITLVYFLFVFIIYDINFKQTTKFSSICKGKFSWKILHKNVAN